MIISVYVNLNPSATNRSIIDSEHFFFLGFYYWDLLSVMLSEAVFNYNFVFVENLHLSQHKENNRCFISCIYILAFKFN